MVMPAGPRIIGLDHVQLAMPKGAENEARAFFVGLLNFREDDKPKALEDKGGCWFSAGTMRLHLGVEAAFRPARKAHPAFVVEDLIVLEAALGSAGHPYERDTRLAGIKRLFTADPFGNRLEFMEARA